MLFRSLAQSAGRCNRNGEMKYGVLKLIQLEGENTGNMEELLRNTDVTEQILYDYRKSGSGESLLTPAWMDQYFKKLYLDSEDRMNFPIRHMDTSIMELLSNGFSCMEKKNFMNQAYKTAGREYRVIDDHSFGVIVPYKDGNNILEAIRQSPDPAEIKE